MVSSLAAATEAFARRLTPERRGLEGWPAVGLLLVSDFVPWTEKRKCHPVWSAAVIKPARASALARAFVPRFLVGGPTCRGVLPQG